MKFLVKEWQNDQYSSTIGKCSLYVTSEEDCWWFTCKDGKVHVKAVPVIMKKQTLDYFYMQLTLRHIALLLLFSNLQTLTLLLLLLA